MPKKLLLCMLIIGLTGGLVGCQSAGPRDPDRTNADNGQPLPRASDELALTDQQARVDVEALLQRAYSSDSHERTALLLQAATALQYQQQWQQSASVLSQLQQLTLVSQEQQHQLALLNAQFAAQQDYWQRVDELLKPLLQPQLTPYNSEATLRLALRSATAQQQWQVAGQTILQLAERRELSSEELWQTLRMVPQPQQLAPSNQPQVAAWRELLLSIHQGLETPALMPALLQQWQQAHPRHPGSAVVAQLTQVEVHAEQRLALVLLPLTGQFREQGQAVLDGMVMRLAADTSLTLQVIDSNQFDFATLPEVLQRYQAEVLVGPLLRDEVARVDASLLPEELTWLSLNEPQQLLSSTPPGFLFFALDPETEVQQAAEFLASKGYQRPLILAPDSNRGHSHIELFTEQWQRFQPNRPVASDVYRNADDMKEIVQEQLGVSASEARINQVKIAAGRVIVDAQARSRADIDVIYLAGSIEHTRLLKPFIDVNISPFMQPIPVYANSASHSARDAISENDLDQVHFSEAPWLLPDHPRYTELQQLLELRRNWGYNLARLAAFGHDAMLLSARSPWLAAVPGFKLSGLTGQLSSQASGKVQRQLKWARFAGHTVVPVR
ncbi:penicillin-binding protein activator [Pseudidiomarina mangrovi]|uniref:penicillin-binding protein activator n=1 Tax=Pseudidiomarina mangrovi TaxID=2487133 RepID=UPI000FCAC7CC|nr:penicillin-binding protein activator [Pseudidiomarina mangrovi]